MKTHAGRKIYSVSEANYFAKQTLEQLTLWVEGEVAEINKNPSYNFFYLTLKDNLALLPCILDGYLLEGFPEELKGQKIRVFGFLSLYEPRGQYQLRIQKIEIAGEGDLARKLELLINKLKAQGLFDIKHKKEIPLYPKKICLLTSYKSDAWNDFITHSVNKFPIIELGYVDIRVQGPQAITGLLKILPLVDKMKFDLIVLTRGGGSLEDLAAFNDEQIARAIFSTKTPIVVAIGHESNESLAEWVADLRASTPLDAATIVTRGYTQILAGLETFKFKLNSIANFKFETTLQKLDRFYLSLEHTKSAFKDLPHKLSGLKEGLRRHEKLIIVEANQSLESNFLFLKKTASSYVSTKKEKLQNLLKSLYILSPENTLRRGYSIARDSENKIIKSVDQVVVGSKIRLRLSDGHLRSKVIEKIKGQKK